jgi:hypothetical protein
MINKFARYKFLSTFALRKWEEQCDGDDSEVFLQKGGSEKKREKMQIKFARIKKVLTFAARFTRNQVGRSAGKADAKKEGAQFIEKLKDKQHISRNISMYCTRKIVILF